MQGFGEDAAETDHGDRTEPRVLVDPHDQLDPVVEIRHRLDRVGRRAEPGVHLPVRGEERRTVRETQGYSARVGLVQDMQGLQDVRTGELIGCGEQFGFTGDFACLRERHAGVGEEALTAW